jgi:4-amino-4-deoxy-L-arabinose transferase-like glycosyltransferase
MCGDSPVDGARRTIDFLGRLRTGESNILIESNVTEIPVEGSESQALGTSRRMAPEGIPAARRPWLHALFPWMALALIGAYALQLALHITHTSVTYDEPVFMFSGYHQWKCGDFGIDPENPPLVKYVAAFPLRSQTLNVPTNGPQCGAGFTGKFDEYIESNQFLVANGIDRVVIPARAATTVFSLLLAVLLLFCVRRMFGEAEALVAEALLAFEPVMIAHGSLATTDMAAAAMFFASVFALYLYWQKASALKVVAMGLSIGAMLASKHSALPALAFLWLLVFAAAWFDSRPAADAAGELWGRLRSGLAAVGVATAIGFVCLWASYGFHFYAMPRAGREILPASALPEGTTGFAERVALMTQWGRAAHILPEAYLFGITDVLRQNILHQTYLLGKTYSHGLWYYFPIAFSAKTSLTLLAMLGLGIFALIRYREKRREYLFWGVPALCYFAFSLTSGLDIGVRHILPVYPFAIAIAAAGACSLARRMPKAWIAIVAMLVFGGVDSARTFPNYISFSNELWGGTNNTYKVLSDSNVDWGQNLKQIRTYIAQNHVGECWIAAPGTPDIALATLPCHLLPASYQWIEHTMDDVPATINGTVFLSTETLPAEFPGIYDSIVSSKPSAFIGGTTFVYTGRFDATAAALLVHTTNSTFLYRHGRLPDAVEEMRDAIALMPDDARLHFTLGMYLMAGGQNGPARDEFDRCVAMTAQNPDAAELHGLAEQQMQRLQ